MTMDQMIDDTIAVTNYLRSRFGQDKIYFLGLSWGSFLGIQVAARASELFHANVGMGQLTYQLRSEVAAYRAQGDTAMVRRLELAPVSLANGLSDAWMPLRDEAMHNRIGVGTTRDMTSVITGVFMPIWRNPAYTLREKIAIWRCKSWSRSILWDEILHTDLTVKVPRLEIPVYFFIGQHDYTTNYDLARDYFRKLDAPLKGFFTFKDSAHSPLFEAPRWARAILQQDVPAKKHPIRSNPTRGFPMTEKGKPKSFLLRVVR